MACNSNFFISRAERRAEAGLATQPFAITPRTVCRMLLVSRAVMSCMSQESLLETETARLLKAKSHASKTRENLDELLKAYRIDTQLEAER